MVENFDDYDANHDGVLSEDEYMANGKVAALDYERVHCWVMMKFEMFRVFI